MINTIKWEIFSKFIELQAVFRKAGVYDKRYKKIKDFKNKYAGESCFICATGPSLIKQDVEKISGFYSFGVNSICAMYNDTDWRPSFFVFQDYPIYEMYSEEIENAKNTYVFIGNPLVNSKNKKINKLMDNWALYPVNWAYHKKAERNKKPFVKFSDDAYSRIYSGYTVTYSAIQLAIYMGFTNIYLLGVDCSYSYGKKNHFKMMKNEINRSIEVAKTEVDNQTVAYKKAKEEAEKRNIKIINVSRGGNLEVFERRNLEDVINGQ